MRRARQQQILPACPLSGLGRLRSRTGTPQTTCAGPGPFRVSRPVAALLGTEGVVASLSLSLSQDVAVGVEIDEMAIGHSRFLVAQCLVPPLWRMVFRWRCGASCVESGGRQGRSPELGGQRPHSRGRLVSVVRVACRSRARMRLPLEASRGSAAVGASRSRAQRRDASGTRCRLFQPVADREDRARCRPQTM